MGMGPGRGMLGALTLINLLATCVTLGIAGWAMNLQIDRLRSLMGPGQLTNPTGLATLGGKPVTPIFVLITLISGVVGVAAIFGAIHHFRVWRRNSMATAQATNLIDLMLAFLALGLACKEIRMGRRQLRLRVLEGFVITLAGLKLLQVLLVHSSMYGSKFGPRLRDETPVAGMVEPQHKGSERPTV